MKSNVKVTSLDNLSADLLAVCVCSVGERLTSTLAAVDRLVSGEVKRLVRLGDFTGDVDQTALIYPNTGASRIVLVGMGDKGALRAGAIRRAVAVAARQAVSCGVGTLAVKVADDVPRRQAAPELVGQEVVEGAAEGAWIFEDLRSEPVAKRALGTVSIVAEQDDRAAVDRGRRRGAAIAAGQVLARNLQMLPGNHCPPRHLATVARDLGRRHDLRVTVMRRAQLEKLGMNALLAVAQGSAEEPRLITLEYRGGRGAPVCLVGKGVTFDSGGISLKPAQKMEEMKFDMSGAAAVIGTFEALGRFRPKINVVGVVPATENLPSGTAIKPGDVVRTHLGKTVEIVNTDAEGRLILCDALSYARRFKPACVVDAATLTGAVVIGLGHHATGVMGNNEDLVSELQRAGESADERCWPMPLWDDYRAQIKSDTADIKNTGGRPAGTITAGWFLREFVEDSTPWAHLDIAGTAYTDESPRRAKGPTGVGVRLFCEFISQRASG